MKKEVIGKQEGSWSFRLLILIGCGLILGACYRPMVNYDPWRIPVGNTQNSLPADPFSTPQSPGTVSGFETALPKLASPTPTLAATITLAPQAAQPTPNAPITLPPLRSEAYTYTVQSGDTLVRIARNNQVSVKQIVEANELKNPDLLNPGDLLVIPPSTVNEQGPALKLIPDSEVYYGPAVKNFDTRSVIQGFNGYLNAYTEEIEEDIELTGAQIVQRVANEYSVNPRLLLAVLEFQSGWVRQERPLERTLDYPLGWQDSNRKGLYKQLSWAANEITRGSTLWGYELLGVWTLSDSTVIRIDPTINAGTAGLQYLLGLLWDRDRWFAAVGETGFIGTYRQLFGDPFAFTLEPLIPEGLTQPQMDLPLASGDLWYFTGGPHWGWGTGSAWAALDFAPSGDELGCFESREPVVAAAAGRVVRSANAQVVIDLDDDGYEQTGWTILYMHIASEGRIPQGTYVEQGDLIGYPSCEGGVSTGTHFHIARRYNGIWIEADGAIPFNLGGWVAKGTGTVYDGYLVKDGNSVEAYNGRSEINEIGN